MRKKIKKIEIEDSFNFQKELITEDDLVFWIQKLGGLVLTRQFNNLKEINLDKIKFVCLTGYNNIIINFYNNLLPKINNNIVLILIESDVINLNNDMINNKKISKIFMWNKNIDHEKITCLPIGLNKDRHVNLKKNINFDNKENLLLVNFDKSTNPVRNKLLEKAKEWNFCNLINNILNEKTYFKKSFSDGKIRITVTSKEYYEILQKYKFVLSPPGAGIDCHRTWEALYNGCIPIIISSTIDEVYQDLPVLIIKNWEEINEDLLKTTWESYIKKEWNYEKLNLRFWIKKMV